MPSVTDLALGASSFLTGGFPVGPAVKEAVKVGGIALASGYLTKKLTDGLSRRKLEIARKNLGLIEGAAAQELNAYSTELDDVIKNIMRSGDTEDLINDLDAVTHYTNLVQVNEESEEAKKQFILLPLNECDIGLDVDSIESAIQQYLQTIIPESANRSLMTNKHVLFANRMRVLMTLMKQYAQIPGDINAERMMNLQTALQNLIIKHGQSMKVYAANYENKLSLMAQKFCEEQIKKQKSVQLIQGCINARKSIAELSVLCGNLGLRLTTNDLGQRADRVGLYHLRNGVLYYDATESQQVQAETPLKAPFRDFFDIINKEMISNVDADNRPIEEKLAAINALLSEKLTYLNSADKWDSVASEMSVTAEQAKQFGQELVMILADLAKGMLFLQEAERLGEQYGQSMLVSNEAISIRVDTANAIVNRAMNRLQALVSNNQLCKSEILDEFGKPFTGKAFEKNKISKLLTDEVKVGIGEVAGSTPINLLLEDIVKVESLYDEHSSHLTDSVKKIDKALSSDLSIQQNTNLFIAIVKELGEANTNIGQTASGASHALLKFCAKIIQNFDEWKRICPDNFAPPNLSGVNNASDLINLVEQFVSDMDVRFQTIEADFQRKIEEAIRANNQTKLDALKKDLATITRINIGFRDLITVFRAIQQNTSSIQAQKVAVLSVVESIIGHDGMYMTATEFKKFIDGDADQALTDYTARIGAAEDLNAEKVQSRLDKFKLSVRNHATAIARAPTPTLSEQVAESIDQTLDSVGRHVQSGMERISGVAGNVGEFVYDNTIIGLDKLSTLLPALAALGAFKAGAGLDTVAAVGGGSLLWMAINAKLEARDIAESASHARVIAQKYKDKFVAKKNHLNESFTAMLNNEIQNLHSPSDAIRHGIHLTEGQKSELINIFTLNDPAEIGGNIKIVRISDTFADEISVADSGMVVKQYFDAYIHHYKNEIFDEHVANVILYENKIAKMMRLMRMYADIPGHESEIMLEAIKKSILFTKNELESKELTFWQKHGRGKAHTVELAKNLTGPLDDFCQTQIVRQKNLNLQFFCEDVNKNITRQICQFSTFFMASFDSGMMDQLTGHEPTLQQLAEGRFVFESRGASTVQGIFLSQMLQIFDEMKRGDSAQINDCMKQLNYLVSNIDGNFEILDADLTDVELIQLKQVAAFIKSIIDTYTKINEIQQVLINSGKNGINSAQLQLKLMAEYEKLKEMPARFNDLIANHFPNIQRNHTPPKSGITSVPIGSVFGQYTLGILPHVSGGQKEIIESKQTEILKDLASTQGKIEGSLNELELAFRNAPAAHVSGRVQAESLSNSLIQKSINFILEHDREKALTESNLKELTAFYRKQLSHMESLLNQVESTEITLLREIFLSSYDSCMSNGLINPTKINNLDLLFAKTYRCLKLITPSNIAEPGVVESELCELMNIKPIAGNSSQLTNATQLLEGDPFSLVKSFIDNLAPSDSRRQNYESLTDRLKARIGELEELCSSALNDIIREQQGIFSSLIYGADSHREAKKSKIDLLMKSLHSIYVARLSSMSPDDSYEFTKQLVDFEQRMIDLNVFGVGDSIEKSQFIELATKRKIDFNALTEQKNLQAQLEKSHAQANTEQWKREFMLQTREILNPIMHNLHKLVEHTEHNQQLVLLQSELGELFNEIAAFNGADRSPLIEKQLSLQQKFREALAGEVRSFHETNAHQVAVQPKSGFLTFGWSVVNTLDAYARWPVQVKFTLDKFDGAFLINPSEFSNLDQELLEIDRLSAILNSLSKVDTNFSIDAESTLYKIARKIITAHANDNQMFLIGLIALQRIHPNIAYVLNNKFDVPYGLTDKMALENPHLLDNIRTKATTVCSELEAVFATKINGALQDSSASEELTSQRRLDLESFSKKYAIESQSRRYSQGSL